ncbi:MAG: pyroglutamyl-peptidase I, partial [Pantoea sp.]|nr:pyroglutamyl-peptidase I [Pantoea sp.]
MKTVLVTAFEPFGGETINPSWEAVRALEGKAIGGARIVARQLPVVFSDVLGVLYAAMDEVEPDLILSVGQAGGRSDITVERIGIN